MNLCDFTVGDKTPFFLIAGTCVVESEQMALDTAAQLKEDCDDLGIHLIYKSSFDKANRSSGESYRGPGLDVGLKILQQVKDELGLPVLTDVHEDTPLDEVCEVVSVLQTPAFLCRQTNFIQNVAAMGLPVNIKKGQFLAPWDVAGILSKTGDAEVWITERGTSFGYNNLVVDFTGIDYMLHNFDVPVVLDATHSVQKPGGNGDSSGGNRDYVPGLCRAASALGVTNFFLEVHPDPDNAPSDGPNMLRLDDFERTVDEIHRYSYTG